MNKRDQFYTSITGKEGITWPESSSERKKQAVDLFGATVMGVLDTIVSNRITDDEEHNKIIKEASASTLYWLFCKLDQFPGANINIDLESFENEEGSTNIIGRANEEELRLMFFEWLEKYSDTVNETEL